jgi:DNA polymerase-1
MLKEKLKEILDENKQEELFNKIELPLVEVLADMEINGFNVDKKQLNNFSDMLSTRIMEVEKRIYQLAGEEFNINSPKQLGTILFEKLQLPIIKKTKTGYSTNVEVLEKLEGEHEIISLIMENRHLVKLKSTYADGLINVINPTTGRIHSSFNQTVTVTGRISSTEPNLQNIPIRTELGREIRKVFVSRDNRHTLIDADYSQIELRVLAHIADDNTLKDAFLNNQDIHKRTASEVFNVPMNEVTNEMRSRAKAVNFGIVYGIGDFSLGKDLKIPRKEAKKYIENYLKKYENVKKYMHNIIEIAKEKGYIETIFKRRRYIPELKSNNFMIRSFGERVALNTPIQGSAADIIKIAMVNVYNKLKDMKLKSKLILQVHDELIIDTYIEEIEIVKKIVNDEMINAVKLSVPLEVDLNVADSWYEAK